MSFWELFCFGAFPHQKIIDTLQLACSKFEILQQIYLANFSCHCPQNMVIWLRIILTGCRDYPLMAFALWGPLSLHNALKGYVSNLGQINWLDSVNTQFSQPTGGFSIFWYWLMMFWVTPLAVASATGFFKN